eukprot:12678979-Ditylum_brightwellii.AAC.1
MKLSVLFTRSDKVFIKAIFDNSYARWESILSNSDNIDQWRPAKYTSGSSYSGAKRNQGWSIESIKQFNNSQNKPRRIEKLISYI